jgi:hypothetical protein
MGPSTWPELGRYPDPIEGVRLLWQGFVGHQFSLLNLQGTYTATYQSVLLPLLSPSSNDQENFNLAGKLQIL